MALKLREIEPGDTGGLEEMHGDGELQQLKDRLTDVQARFSAEASNALLIVLQGMDGSGKDRVIANLLRACHPANLRVYNFTAPSDEERAHDFLWRFHPHTPARGMVHVFDRSHYEEVIYPRVHRLLDDEQWRARLESINDFERMLHREGTRIVKLMIHVSRKTQGQRLEARLEVPEERHEFSANDIIERKYWQRYQRAYQDVLAATHTTEAPWHVVPADHAWFIPIAAGRVIVDCLESLEPVFPDVDNDELKRAGLNK